MKAKTRTVKKVEDALTEQEENALNRICREPGCYRRTAPGYIICLNCLHGTSPLADEEAIAAKKKWDRIQKAKVAQ